MAHTTVALDLGQTLDVKRDITAQVALYHDVVFVDVVADLGLFISGQILDAADEIARTMVFLADEASGYITGQVLGVNGGLVI